LLQRISHLFVEDVGVACRRLDVGVVECPLHELEIAGVAEQFRPHVMPDVVDSGANESRHLRNPGVDGDVSDVGIGRRLLRSVSSNDVAGADAISTGWA